MKNGFETLRFCAFQLQAHASPSAGGNVNGRIRAEQTLFQKSGLAQGAGLDFG